LAIVQGWHTASSTPLTPPPVPQSAPEPETTSHWPLVMTDARGVVAERHGRHVGRQLLPEDVRVAVAPAHEPAHGVHRFQPPA
jgi:hypothetical protein